MGILKKGDKGSKVKALQEKLNKSGAKPKLKITSQFDGPTEDAVKAIQKKVKIKIDGKVGKTTMDFIENGTKPLKWTVKDTTRAHKQMNDQIEILARDRKEITKLAKEHGKDKDVKMAFRNYNIYADAFQKEMKLMKDSLNRIDFLKISFDGGFGDGPSQQAYYLGQAQYEWKDLERRNAGAAKLENAYSFEHDNFLKTLESVPA